MRCFLAIHSMIFFERSQVTYANVSKWSILQYNKHKFYSTQWKIFLIRQSHNPLSHNMCLVPHEIISPIVVSLNQGILNPFGINIMCVSLYTVISKHALLRESLFEKNKLQSESNQAVEQLESQNSVYLPLKIS